MFDLHLTSSRLKNVSFNITTHFVLDKQNELCELMVYFRNSIICTRDRRKLAVSIELECDVTNIPALIMIYRHPLSVFEFLSVMVREDGSALVVWQDVVNRFDFRRT